jgi:hypothetical protein
MLRSTRFHTLAAVVATITLVAACANDATAPTAIESDKGASTETGIGASGGTGVSPSGFLRCTAQPYAADSAWIGPKGGEIKIGKNEFKVPKGALDELTLITMELPSDTVKSVRFGPEGLTFNPGAWPELKLDYKGCEKEKKGKGKGKGEDKVRLVYTTEQLEVIQILPSADDELNENVQTHLKHFSRYAVYY